MITGAVRYKRRFKRSAYSSDSVSQGKRVDPVIILYDPGGHRGYMRCGLSSSFLAVSGVSTPERHSLIFMTVLVTVICFIEAVEMS